MHHSTRRRQRGRAVPIAAGALALLAAVTAFFLLRTPPADLASAPGTAAAPQATVPVVVYLIDTLRADHLEVYGYPKPTSPRLRELAAQSVVFDAAYAAAPWTLPSVASLMTSSYVCEHGVVAPELKLSPTLRTLAERLKAMGYFTGAYYGNLLAGPTSGLDRGFDVSQLEMEDDIRNDDTRAFLERVGVATPFLYLHTMEPHQPYLADYKYIRDFGHVPIDTKVKFDDYWTSWVRLKRVGPTARAPQLRGDATAELERILAGLDRLRAEYQIVYDASVRQADANLGDVIDVLKERGIWDQALVVVLADHGEEFGEHGVWFHEESMYEPVARVPLLIRFPGGAHAGTRVAEPVSLVDVAPTILDSLGRSDLCDDCRGTSLMPLVRGGANRGAAPAVPGLRINATTYHRPIKERRGDVNVVVREQRWKAVWNEEPQSVELYDLAADPGERADRAAVEPQLAQRLRLAASRWLGDCRAALQAPEERELDARTLERLRALGYAQ